MKVRGKGMWPFHRERPAAADTLCCQPYVANNEREAVVSPEAIALPGSYVVSVRAEGEPLAESHRAHLVAAFSEQRPLLAFVR